VWGAECRVDGMQAHRRGRLLGNGSNGLSSLVPHHLVLSRVAERLLQRCQCHPLLRPSIASAMRPSNASIDCVRNSANLFFHPQHPKPRHPIPLTRPQKARSFSDWWSTAAAMSCTGVGNRLFLLQGFTFQVRCQENMAHIKESRPDSGRGVF